MHRRTSPPGSPSASSRPSASGVQRLAVPWQAPARWLLGLEAVPLVWLSITAAALVAALVVLCARVALGANEKPARATPGDLEVRDALVPLPATHLRAFLASAPCASTRPSWTFKGYQAPDLAALLDAAGLTPAERDAVGATSRCDAAGCIASPSIELVEGLGADSRRAVYTALSRFDENVHASSPFRRRVELPAWSAAPGLSAEARRLLDALTYRQERQHVFADLEVLCARLPAGDERARVFEVLLESSATAARVVVPKEEGMEAVARYWQWGQPGLDAREALETDAADLTELLPPFARERLDTFQSPSDVPRDCFWTATHFLDEVEPDPRSPPVGAEELRRRLRAEYVQVALDELRLGDVLAFYAGDELIHVANHVAGELAFTKNGARVVRPWVLHRLGDVLAAYPATTSVAAYRLRRLASPP